MRTLRKGDPRLTFVVGAILSFPGVSYLDALDHIHKLKPGTAATVALVVYFCLMQLILIEVPLAGYAVAPDGTDRAATRFKDWIGRRARTGGMAIAGVIGVALVVRGIVTLL